MDLLACRAFPQPIWSVRVHLALQAVPHRSEAPETLVGDDARAFMKLVNRLFDRMDFWEITVHGPTPSGVIAAEYKSNGLTKTGKPYPNVYAAFFEVRDGKVSRWREYFNPDVVAAAMS